MARVNHNTDMGAGKGSGEQKGVREPKGSGEIKKTEVPVFFLIRSLILHLHISHPHLHLHSLFFSCTHSPTPSHCRIR